MKLFDGLLEEQQREMLNKIADSMQIQIDYIREAPREELKEIILLFNNVRDLLEKGYFDTADKKWSDLKWRV